MITRFECRLPFPRLTPPHSDLVRALQRDAAARYQSAEAFGRALTSLQSDPVTAHSQSVEFYAAAKSLTEGAIAPANYRKPQQHPSPATMILPASSDVSSSERRGTNGAALAIVTILFGMLVGIGWMLWQQEQEINPAAQRSAPTIATEEPAGPAGIGAPGEVDNEIPKPATVRVAIDRTKSDEPEEPPSATQQEPEPPVKDDVVQGSITIGAIQPGSEVYIDGKFIRKVPVRRSLDPGSYDITIIAPDGRRKSFRTAIKAEKTTRRVWDFDRGGWR